MKKVYWVFSFLVLISFSLKSQVIHDVCVAEVYASGSCSNNLGVFTPSSITISQGDIIRFTTRMEQLGGYNGNHDIRFTGSPANNVLLPISTNILAPWTTVNTPPFATVGTFAMECVNGNHCTIADLFSGWPCNGYSVTVLPSSSGCNVSAGFTASDTLLCPGQSTSFTNSSSGASGFEWFIDGGFYSTATDTSFSYTSGGAHTVMMVASDSSCSDTVYQTIYSSNLNSLNPVGSSFICDIGGTNGVLCADTSGGPYSYQWCNGSASYCATGLSPGMCCVTITDWMGCMTQECGSVLASSPNVNLGPDASYCIGDTVLLTGANPPNTNFWCGGNTTLYYVATNSGTYCLTVTDTNGCSATDSVFLTFNAPPTPSFSFIDNLGVVDFTDLTSGSAVAWSWDFGDGNTGNTQNPQHAYAAGTYFVCLTVTDSAGCSAEYCDSVTVTITGIASGLINTGFNVYPVPSSGMIVLESIGFDIEDRITVFSMTGRSLVQIYPEAGKTKIEADLSKLPDGIYMIEFMKEGNRECRKMILQK